MSSQSSGPQSHDGLTDSIGLELVQVPAGEFLMGNHDSPEELARAFPSYPKWRIDELTDEVPVHRVRITRPFHFGIGPVTVGQFARFVAETAFQTEPEREGTGGYGYEPTFWDAEDRSRFRGRSLDFSWRNPGFPQGTDHPVVNVTWNDAVDFCRWLGNKEGVTYRLPTEAEWEYACRAGTTTRWSCGNDQEALVEFANLFDEDCRKLFPEWSPFAIRNRDGFVFTSPIGSFQPNAFGLHDMHGNVWEWCSDWYDEHYYACSPVKDPQGAEEGSLHVRRGGSWNTWPFYARSSFRNYNYPNSRYLLLGFRVVREVGR